MSMPGTPENQAAYPQPVAQKPGLGFPLLDAVASHLVGDRPDRYEPRRKKRRPKPYDRLMKPRHEAKREMLKRVREK